MADARQQIARVLDAAARHAGFPYAVLGVGIMVRLIWALLVPVVPVSDSLSYGLFAGRLSRGLGYTWLDGSASAFWPVGTSAIYALLYRLFGTGHGVIVGFNILLFVPILLLSMRLTARWFGAHAAAISGVMLAFWPMQIEFTTILASELIFTTLVLIIVALWDAESLSPLRRGILLGIMLAVASYVRPTALLLTCVLMLSAAARGQGARRLPAVVISVVVAALLIAPWAVRNSREFHRPVLLSTNGGVTLWMGNHANSGGGYAEVPAEFAGLDEATRDERMGGIAKAYIRAHPGQFVWNSLRRLQDTFGRETIGIAWNEPGLVRAFGPRVLVGLKLVSQAYWLAVLALGLAGFVLLAMSLGVWRAVSHPGAITWLYFAGVHAVIVSQDRYHFPVTPYIAGFAGMAVWAMVQRSRHADPAVERTARPSGMRGSTGSALG